MRPRCRTLFAFAAVAVTVVSVSLGWAPCAVALEDVYSPARVVTDVTQLDGLEIGMEGEVIGDRLHADEDHVWLNILGEGTAVGVYLDKDLADRVETFGDYSHRGDVIHVRAVVNAACDQHGGDLDVHALALEVVSSGHEIEHDVELRYGIAGIIGIVAAALLSRVYRRRRLRTGEHV